MEAAVLEAIKQKFGDRATDAGFERSLYARDLAPVPDLLVNPLFRTIPDLVVCPADTAEVAEVLKLANEKMIPVTPRAGASTAYFNTVPCRGGILLDLNRLKGVLQINEEELYVELLAGTTWQELEQSLAPRGLAPGSVPSSAPASSVAGWLCMMGHGIGSLKYGSLLSQVFSLEVVLPDGTVQTVTEASRPAISWFACSEGTLGIITKMKLRVRKLTPMRHFLIHGKDTLKTLQLLQDVKEGRVVPYNLHFTDPSCVRAMSSQGIAPDGVRDGCLLAVDYEGNEEELQEADSDIRKLLDRYQGCRLLPEAAADEEWQERYRSLKLKRGGPSELGAEVWLPVKNLASYLDDVQQLASRYRMDICSYGHVATPERIIMMSMFFADETRTLKYVIDLAMVKKIHDIGYRYGGYPYGVGLWNTPYLGRIYDRHQLTTLRSRKRELDPRGILNPGKLYHWHPLLNPCFFGLGMNLLAGFRRLTGGSAAK